MKKIVKYILVCGNRENVEELVDSFLTKEPIFELYGHPFSGKEYDEDKEEYIDCVYQAMVMYAEIN